MFNCGNTLKVSVILKGKGKGKCIAVHGTPSHTHSYGVPLDIWDHTVLPATCAFTPAKQAGTRLTYPGGMEGCVDLGDLSHTKMV